MHAFHPTCTKDCFLSRNTIEPSSEPIRVPQKYILIAYHTPKKKLRTACSGGYSLGSPNYLYRNLSSRSLRFLDS